MVLNLFWAKNNFFKKYLMDHVAVVTPHEQLLESVLHIGQ